MPLRELGLRKLWSAVRPGEEATSTPTTNATTSLSGGLPLLQVWPSQDSPRGEADGQSFVFPAEEGGGQHDSGIESVQVSPCPINPPPPPSCSTAAPSTAAAASNGSPVAGQRRPSTSSPLAGQRRPSSALLHPDHARLLSRSPELQASTSVDEAQQPLSCSSSSASSLASVAAVAATACSSRTSDSERRRSSARYSLLDALDLEYALLRAAARGSVGPYSLSESLHKLTFTQSLAFPALARGLAGKRRRSETDTRPARQHGESGLNAFAKVVTALVLVLVSVLVFGVVYKFVRT